MPKNVTEAQFEQFVEANSQALMVLSGLIADVAGHVKTAVHLEARAAAYAEMQPNPIRDRMLGQLVRSALITARNTAPTDPVVQSLCAKWLPVQRSH